MRDLLTIESLVSGNMEIMDKYEWNKKFRYEYGDEEFYLSRLNESQLEELRSDICLCSYYIDDYKNRFRIDPKTVCMFFDLYADFLSELMQENNIDCDAFFENLQEFDTTANLCEWHCIVYGR